MFRIKTVCLQDFQDPAKETEALAAIDSSLQTCGFFGLIDNTFSKSLQDRVFQTAIDYFSDELMCKKTVAEVFSEGQVLKGYSPVSAGQTTHSAVDSYEIRLSEKFSIRSEKEDSFLKGLPLKYRNLFGQNVWPDTADFREAYLAYMRYAESLGNSLSKIFAQVLKIEPEFFLRNIAYSPNNLRINHYTYGHLAAGNSRPIHLGAHKDFGLFTILLTDGNPGLEVMIGKDWREIEVDRGAFIINSGEILSMITNDYWRTPFHRVRQPLGAVALKRTSLAYFIAGNHSWQLDCLPGFCDEQKVWKYSVGTVEEHLISTMNKLSLMKSNSY